MSKLLSIDALNNTIAIAIIIDDRIVVNFVINNQKTHSEELMPAIDKALKFASLNISDIEHIITTNGPGSFTGMRITLSCIKALSHIHNIPIHTVSTLRATSYNVRYLEYNICSIIDARRNQVYSGTYNADIEILQEDCWKLSELLDKLSGQKTIFVGEGVDKYAQKILDADKNFILANQADNTSSALGAYIAYKKGYAKTHNYESIEANYLRIPQAQRELEERCKIL